MQRLSRDAATCGSAALRAFNSSCDALVRLPQALASPRVAARSLRFSRPTAPNKICHDRSRSQPCAVDLPNAAVSTNAGAAGGGRRRGAGVAAQRRAVDGAVGLGVAAAGAGAALALAAAAAGRRAGQRGGCWRAVAGAGQCQRRAFACSICMLESLILHYGGSLALARAATAAGRCAGRRCGRRRAVAGAGQCQLSAFACSIFQRICMLEPMILHHCGAKLDGA